LHRAPGASPDARFSLGLVIPQIDGTLRQVFFGDVLVSQLPAVQAQASDAHAVSIEIYDGGTQGTGAPAQAPTLLAVADPAPSVIGVVQQADADQFVCEGTPIARGARVVAVLFSEDITPAEAQDKVGQGEISKYGVDGNKVVGVALQPGRRIVFLALRDPIGPFVSRSLTVGDVADRRGQRMASPETRPIVVTVPPTAGRLSGQILNATGQPAAYANVRLFYQAVCDEELVTFGVSSKPADENGRYSFDYVWRPNISNVKLVALDPDTEQFRELRFNIARDAQHLTVDVVFLGRGSIEGHTFDEQGRPLPNTVVRVTSLTDQSQFGTTTDADGKYRFDRVPVGNVLIEAVSVTPPAQVFISENIPSPGAVVVRDFTLYDVNTAPIQPTVGTISGFVLRADGTTPVGDVPVYAYYRNRSQAAVRCPPPPGGIEPEECAIAVTRTDAGGAFVFDRIPSGELRLTSFDQSGLEQGDASVRLQASGTVSLNILIVGGLGTVTGVVLDPSGAVVAGARVGGGLSIQTADAQGRFTLTDVPVGRRTLVAVSDALATRGETVIDVIRAGDTYNATIVLSSIGSVAGIVRESNGTTPVPGITVYLLRDCTVVDPQTGQSVPAACIDGQATTDTNGGYRIDGINVGAYRLSAFRSNFSDGNIVPVSIQYFRQVARGDITFRGQGRIVGTVFDDDGVTPLPAYVSVSGDQLVIAGGKVGSKFQRVDNYRIVETSFDGSFAFSNVWAGGFTVRAAGQFSPDPIAFEGTMVANTTATLNLRLQPTSEITGTVFQPDGVTPAGANVVVKYKSEAFKVFCAENAFGDTECETIPQGIQEEVVVTDEQGRYRLPIVNAGAFTITAEDAASGRVAAIKGAVRAGETGEFAVRLLSTSDVHVRVFAANRDANDQLVPIPGARVEIEQIDAPRKTLERVADATGVARFGGGDAFSEGEFVVRVTDLRNGFVGRKAGRVTSDGALVTVDVFLFDATGVMTGTIFEPDGITPVPNAEVVISNAGGALAFAVTGPDGVYREAEIPLGVVRVEAFDARTASRGFGEARIDFNAQEVPLNVSLAALGVVRGTLLEAGSLLPLKNWQVTLSQAAPSGRALPQLRTSTGIDGSFSFPGAAVGAFTVHASKINVPDTATASGAIVRPGQIVDVPMVVNIARPATGRITGIIVDANGSPAGNSEVVVTGPTGTRRLTADGGGAFLAEELTLGRYAVTATSQVTNNTGTFYVDLAYNGQTANIIVALVGLSQVSGVVVDANGQPVTRPVNVRLTGSPATGCDGDCQASTDAAGAFAFVNLAARTFTITATDPVTGLRGSIGDQITPGANRSGLRIVLEPAASVSGAVSFPDGSPAPNVVAELVRGASRLFAETGPDGRFSFATVSLAQPRLWSLTVRDPIGTGLARRTFTLDGLVDLGTIALDTAPPAITQMAPANGATGVPLDSDLVVTFSEPLDLATVNAANIVISDASGQIAGTLSVTGGDRVVTFRPLSPLRDQVRYTVAVEGVEDRLDKVMTPFSAAFTTVDITAPTTVDLSPQVNASGVTIYAAVRVKYNEPIDPARFAGPPITLRLNGALVDGRIDYALGNTVVVFSPARPLGEDLAYQLSVDAATDPAGNRQGQGTSFTFTTTDRTPPSILSLVPDGGSTVIENAVARVVASVGSADVAFVDFFINDVAASVSRTAPFALSFQAIPAFGRPGDAIRVGAIATDTSGNRGLVPVETIITVAPDQVPSAAITAPAAGISARNGDRITVTVAAMDDLGISQVGYRANTGDTRTAGSIAVAPGTLARTETFGFDVPATVVPGTTFTIDATVQDSKGQFAQAVPVTVTVLDGVKPTVEITGVTTGDRVRPGRTVTAVVVASDPGKVASIGFTATGAGLGSETRTIAPAQASVAASFTFTVDPSAGPTDRVTLDAFAVDLAGNRAEAGRVLLPIADAVPPTVTLRTTDGRLDIVPGRPFSVIAEADDEIGVTRVTLSGTGAFSFSDAKSISPALGSVSATFVVNVPESVTAGQTLTLTARSVDLSSNVSQAATLALTARVLSDVTLPSSALLLAGDTATTTIEVPTPAGAGGLRIDLASASTGIASVPAFVTIPQDALSATFGLSGVSGGTTTVTASIDGIQRTSMTATVRGGVVRGRVIDTGFQPVSGAGVTVSGANAVTTTTDADGRFIVEGVAGAGFTGQAVVARVFDDATDRLGVGNGTFNVANGFVNLADIIVLPAGTFVVTSTDQANAPTGAGVRVDLRRDSGGTAGEVIATAFTDAQSVARFDLVAPGTYFIESSDTGGNRGRIGAVISTTGSEVPVTVKYLGRGTVQGTVRNSSGGVVPNASLRLNASSLFGNAPERTASAAIDGTFSFANVFVGTFSVSATDPISQTTGGVSGAMAQHAEVVTADVSLTPFSNLQGTVFRADGVTATGAGTTVTVNRCTYSSSCYASTTTNEQGQYRFNFLPLAEYTVTAVDAATRSLARTTASLFTNGATPSVNLTFAAQGTLVVLVTDSNDAALPGASVTIDVSNGSVSDRLSATTGADGRAVVDHVLAGSVSVSATSGGLSGSASTTLAGGGVQNVTVKLQPTATITGTIYLPNGQSPAGSGSVRVRQDNVWPYTEFVTTLTDAASGAYRFDRLPLGVYTVRVYDSAGQFRAIARAVGLETNNEVEARDLSFVGLGTVRGRVANPDGSSASGIGVVVQCLVADFGVTRYVLADGGGNYEATRIPVGTVVATAQTGALIGERRSRLALDGDVLPLDILLENNAVTLPTTLYDANVAPYDVQPNGTMRYGHNYPFQGDNGANAGASQLTIVRNGTPEAFAGASFGTLEQQRREVVIRQESVNGVAVTRKVYVPTDGYFARYLDVITNTSSEPVTIDVTLATNYRNVRCCSINLVATSSGDAQATTADRWVVLDDFYNGDPYETYETPSTAVVFGDQQGVDTPDVVSVSTSNPGQVATTWQQITIPAGGSVAYLSFVSQQPNQNSARKTAERLLLLPPEALEGLNSTELAVIANFAAPADGVGTVTALPASTGVVTGTVFEGDGTTVVPNATVTFQSDSPFFNRRIRVPTNAAGGYSIQGATGSQLPVPVEGFRLQAAHPNNTATMPLQAAAFAPGQSSTVADIVFTGFGVIEITALRRDATPIEGLYVYVDNGPQGGATYTDAQGHAVFGGMRPGTYEFFGEVYQDDGTGPRLEVTPVALAAGQKQSVTYSLEPTGSLRLLVTDADGNPVPNAYAWLSGVQRSFSRYGYTNAVGVVQWDALPAAEYLAASQEPASGFETQARVTTVVDQVTDLAIRHVPIASLTVATMRTSGGPALGTYVQVQAQNGGYYNAGRPNSNGLITFTNVPVGIPLRLVAYVEENSNLRVETPLTLDSRTPPTATLTLPPFGAITGVVTSATGGLVTGRCLVYASASGYSDSTCTNSLGVYRFDGVPVGAAVTLSVYDNNFNYQKRVAAQLANDAEVLVKDLSQPGVGTALLTVKQGDGTVMPNVRVEYRHETDGSLTYRGLTSATGQITLTSVVEGTFTVRLRNSGNTFTLAQRDLVMPPSGHATTTPYEIVVNTFTGTVSGVVTLADGTTPTSGVNVELRAASDNGYLAAVSASATGTFSFSNVTMPDGGFSVQAYWNRDSSVRATPQVVTLTAGGQTANATVIMPLYMGTVDTQVTSGPSNTPVAGAQIYLYTPNYGYITAGATDAAGRLTFDQIMPATFNLILQLAGLPNGQLRLTGQALDLATKRATVDIHVDELVGTIGGTLTAKDGVTPISYANIELMVPCGPQDECDPGVLRSRTSFSTAVDGTYQMSNLAIAPGAVFRIHAPSRWEATHDVPVAFTAAGQVLVFDVLVPFSVVSGTATFTTGTPVQYPNVIAAAAGESYYGAFNDGQGRFRLYALPAGDFSLTVNDDESGLSSTVQSSLASADEVKIVDVVMPPSNDITVSALGPDAAPLTIDGICFALQSAGLAYYRDDCAYGTSGTITFTNVPLGPIHVQSYYYDGLVTYESVYASVVADVPATPTPFPVEVSYATATRSQVTVTVLNADGTAAGTDAYVYLYPFGASGPYGYDDVYESADAEGKARFTNQPPGPARVEVESYNETLGKYEVAVEPLVLMPGQTTEVTLRLGSGAYTEYDLVGDDGFYYTIDSEGELDNSNSGTFSSIFSTNMIFGFFGDESPCCQYMVKLAQAGREVQFGPSFSDASVLSERKIYSPQEGGFVRYLDTFTNILPYEREIEVRYYQRFSYTSDFAFVDDAVKGGFTVVPLNSGQPHTSVAYAGIVTHGAGAVSSAVINSSYPIPGNSNNRTDYAYRVRVPAYGSVSLLHFAAQRGPADLATLQTQVRSLQDLTDSKALFGLSAAEKARIKNFIVP
jgi:hypothetical protein